MTRTNRLEAALLNVEKLLDGHINSMKKATAAAKKPPAKKPAAKAPAKKAAPAKKPVAKKPAAKKPVKGSTKVQAIAKPNLMKLKRLIDRGAIDSEELIAAVVEALRSQRVKTPVVGGVAQVLRNALADLDVIDVADYAEAPGQGGFGPGLVPTT